jgi:hypothetical protein
VISMDLINICPNKIQTRNCPEQKLYSDKNS